MGKKNRTENGYSEIKRTPKNEKHISGETYSYGVQAFVETCSREWVRLIVLECEHLVLTRRFLIVAERKQAVKAALLVAGNYFDNNEGRLAMENQQRPLLAIAV